MSPLPLFLAPLRKPLLGSRLVALFCSVVSSHAFQATNSSVFPIQDPAVEPVVDAEMEAVSRKRDLEEKLAQEQEKKKNKKKKAFY